MDQPLILEFQSLAEAQACLAAINALAATYWISQGYTVIETGNEKQLVGKNAATGEDMPQSARTLSWDVVRESPDSTWYIFSLSSDSRFAGGMAQLSGFSFTEKILPQGWVGAGA